MPITRWHNVGKVGSWEDCDSCELAVINGSPVGNPHFEPRSDVQGTLGGPAACTDALGSTFSRKAAGRRSTVHVPKHIDYVVLTLERLVSSTDGALTDRA